MTHRKREYGSSPARAVLLNLEVRMSSNMKVYIVEDNPIILENLQSTLEDISGVELVGDSGTEAQAVNWLSNNAANWDVAVLDLFLKAGTGLGVLEKLGKLTDQKKVLVLSNYAGRDIRQQCLKLGASAVFDKSQEIDAFVDHISHLAQA